MSYAYHEFEPKREGPLRWRWMLDVLNGPETDIIGTYTGTSLSPRRALRASHRAMRKDALKRQAYERR